MYSQTIKEIEADQKRAREVAEIMNDGELALRRLQYVARPKWPCELCGKRIQIHEDFKLIPADNRTGIQIACQDHTQQDLDERSARYEENL